MNESSTRGQEIGSATNSRRQGTRIQRIALGFAVAMLAAAAVAAPAAAATNVTGPVTSTGVVCMADFSYGNQMYVPVPNIWASNRRAGAGNDPQTVMYWTRAVDLAGNPLTAWAFDGQGTANDNAPASLPYAWRFYRAGNIYSNHRYYITGSVRAQVKVAWYEGSTLLGVLDVTLAAYYPYSFGFQNGVYPSC
jgi:hypothetical protein